jgi:hypothetical protein
MQDRFDWACVILFAIASNAIGDAPQEASSRNRDRLARLMGSVEISRILARAGAPHPRRLPQFGAKRHKADQAFLAADI